MTTPQVQEILLAARNHNITELRALLREISANVQDPETGTTPLHAAIPGAQDKPNVKQPSESDSVSDTYDAHGFSTQESAQKTVKLLLENGAIWNDLDTHNETPGCLALRLGLKDLYEIMVDAGVRAEMLLNRLDGYEALSGEDDEAPAMDEGNDDSQDANDSTPALPTTAEESPDFTLQNQNYLKHPIQFQDGRILDSTDSGVMMQWETKLMQRHAELLCPRAGLRILNIGFGLGKSSLVTYAL